MLLNLHTHLPTGDAKIREIENLDREKPLSGRTPWFSAGLHPWFLEEGTLATAGAWLRQQAEQAACVAIGETGLDKITDTPWALQQAAFRLCIQVALAHDKPLVLHCVRAYAETLAQLAEQQATRFVFHGFDKHPQTAAMLLHAGAYLSFGAALFSEKSHAAAALRECPNDRLFLETDDRELPIREVYERAADLKRTTVEALEKQIRENAVRFFRRDDLL